MIHTIRAKDGREALQQVPRSLIAREFEEGVFYVFTRIEDAIGHPSSSRRAD